MKTIRRRGILLGTLALFAVVWSAAGLRASASRAPALSAGPASAPYASVRDVMSMPATGPARVRPALPPGLPAHFGIGLAALPDSTGLTGWMPDSGISWDYAYQYLSAGVNTGSGWETWNGKGQFPLYYAQSAASHHYIPVFSYYDLLQSNGSCNSCPEPQRDLSNLNNAGTMKSYFQNFALLMKRLGPGRYGGIAGYGKTAIVHVEPDLSGYANQAVLDIGGNACYGYCTGQGNDPALLKAAVASSGAPGVSAYPNTYQGFNWALLHLRDLYAPNVLLAFHVSDWATGDDIGSDSGTSVNATALGQQAGAFAARAGISGVPRGTSSYDLLFNDVSDRDAGYYKYVLNKANAFWDRLNVIFPNFHRWESYVAAASQVSGRPAMVWQVPEGNQYFDTENNSNGHYQDNRAEYFFGHIAELAQSGVIGVLFGAGNAGSTVHWDGMKDGITNPSGFCTGDGLSSGQVCNNHTSTVSDDDGGYIRVQARQYYASGGYPLSGPMPPSDLLPPHVPTPSAARRVTAKPVRTATAKPSAATGAPPTFTFGATTESAATIARGAAERFTATITASRSVSNELVDFEVYNSAGRKVWQTYLTAVRFKAGVPRRCSASFAIPALLPRGVYTLKLGVFTARWAFQAWDNGAATFTVGR